jgi:hypothetical protein
MKPCGVARVTVSHNAQIKNLNLYVVPVEGPTLFGREWLQHISLDWPTIKSLMSATDKISDTCSSTVISCGLPAAPYSPHRSNSFILEKDIPDSPLRQIACGGNISISYAKNSTVS